MDRMRPNFCMHIIIDKIDVGIVNRCFLQICNRVTTLIDVRIWFLLHILRMNGQNLTKFSTHIIIDKINMHISLDEFKF